MSALLVGFVTVPENPFAVLIATLVTLPLPLGEARQTPDMNRTGIPGDNICSL
jgi:hypothetical protein